jgi:hypothetical protein
MLLFIANYSCLQLVISFSYKYLHYTRERLVADFLPLLSGVRDRVCHVGFSGGQSGAGAGFLRVLRFPLPIFIPPIAPKILIYHLGFVQ